MSSKTTFLFAVVVALALFGSSAFAVPLQVINAPSTDDVENITPTPSETVPVQEQQAKSSDAPAETPVAVVGTEPSQQVQQKQDAKTDEVVQSAVASEVPPVAADAESGPGTKTEPESPAAEPDVEIIEVFKPLKFDGPRPPVPATPALGQSNPETQPNAVFGKPAPLIPAHQKPNRYYPNDVQPVKLGLDMPFTFMEYLQPFPQPFHQAGHNQPPRHQQQPFGASVDPFEPFISPMMGSPLNRLVEAYTNEFRTPEVLVKPKRNVRPNSTLSIPPIPVLVNVVLNAFGYNPPSDMLNAFDASISQMHNNMGAPQTIPEKPVTKTTSKTEVIDGHLVQINETTYSNGDGNHKSFYHFKEIQVLPDNKTKTITNENSMSVTKDERDEETNEIKRDQPSGTFVASSAVVVDDETQNLIKKNREPVPLDDHFQTAAASYYAPYAPYVVPHRQPSSSASLYYGRPPGPGHYPGGGGRPYRPTAPISLHGDTLVNQLVAAQQQASGANAVPPPDVEIIDVNKKPLRPVSGAQYYYYDNSGGGGGGGKFAGRKN